MIYCYICYEQNIDEDFICDICENYYCEGCSYTFSIHYQHEGARCYLCADQRRRKKLEKEVKIDNRLKLLKI